ncbi:NAD(P)-binding Rossmann-fold containing protein [Glarea lozoyensis ATCC 20868]|uniref:NAD(P)-binding Rossmann-fold containing protein n=1 Tax=Glarea lozoyensis (strain ATCC 20868 / MF5171) TaxID=1116229 RepID=S3CV34_GLAL2|nr:NAD(P)-binding Rossmann-fold containing protein [Glarea lozoyensis ATCC 20868]EPE28814.1 NAD(P)-binding Rossmann-fold containing protein [Glarea lozoyensis ATCC 20868]
MGVTFSQFFPPSPTLTEADLPNQAGKVFIVTGGYSGVGKELCTILYQAGGTVYLAGRSKEKAQEAISYIKRLEMNNKSLPGKLVFLELSLDNLATIKPAVERFTSVETRLDVLFNNAGVSNPPPGSISVQGDELQMATNCLGPHLLTQLLLPIMRKTGNVLQSPGAVRVIWTSSIIVDLSVSKEGISLKELTTISKNQQYNYLKTKLSNWFLASHLATQVGADADGILSLTINPGNMKTGLLRHMPAIVGILFSPILYHARMGAYTALWAGLSKKLNIHDGGKYILPWGRIHPSPRVDLLDTMSAREFVEFCDRKIVDFM